MTKTTPGKTNSPPQQESAEHPPAQHRLILRRVRTTQEALRLESPRYPQKCKRWKDIEELRYKAALTELLRQGKTPAVVAEYLNCSINQIYAAMKAHNIPTARAYAPAKLEHHLNLNEYKKHPR